MKFLNDFRICNDTALRGKDQKPKLYKQRGSVLQGAHVCCAILKGVTHTCLAGVMQHPCIFTSPCSVAPVYSTKNMHYFHNELFYKPKDDTI